MTGPQLNHRSEPVPVLDYGRPQRSKFHSAAAVLGHFCTGFFLWVATLLVVSFLMGMLHALVPYKVWIACAPVLAVAAVIGIAVYARTRLNMPGLIAGLLVGFCLTCLMPIGLVAVISSQWR